MKIQSGHTRYIKKESEFKKAWRIFNEAVISYTTALTFRSEAYETKLYEQYCKSIGFKSKAINGLKNIAEDFDKDQKKVERLEKKFESVEASIRGLEGREWDGSVKLETVYTDCEDQISTIREVIGFLREDEQQARHLNNATEVQQIQNFINIHIPRLNNIIATYNHYLQLLKDMNDRQAGR